MTHTITADPHMNKGRGSDHTQIYPYAITKFLVESLPCGNVLTLSPTSELRSMVVLVNSYLKKWFTKFKKGLYEWLHGGTIDTNN